MKKIVLIATVIAICSFILPSCEKSDPNPSDNNSIHGLWIGTYTINGQTTTDTYYSFIIKPGGILLVEAKFLNQQEFANGTWTLSGKTLTCVFTHVYAPAGHVGTTQSATATWDNSGKLTNGTWMNVSPANGVTGTFTLTKIN